MDFSETKLNFKLMAITLTWSSMKFSRRVQLLFLLIFFILFSLVNVSQSSSILLILRGGAGANPSCHWASGGVHPGQVASLSQGRHIETNNHSHSHSQPRTLLLWGASANHCTTVPPPLVNAFILYLFLKLCIIIPHICAWRWSIQYGQYGLWTGSWRGASSPPGQCQGAAEKGNKPLTARALDCVAAPSL